MQKVVRERKLLDQIVHSLKDGIKNMTTVHKPTIYNENLLLNILKLMNSAIDGNQ